MAIYIRYIDIDVDRYTDTGIHGQTADRWVVLMLGSPRLLPLLRVLQLVSFDTPPCLFFGSRICRGSCLPTPLVLSLDVSTARAGRAA